MVKKKLGTKERRKYTRVDSLYEMGIEVGGVRPNISDLNLMPGEEAVLLGLNRRNNPYLILHLCQQSRPPYYSKPAGHDTFKIKCACGLLQKLNPEKPGQSSKILVKDQTCIYNGDVLEDKYCESCPVYLGEMWKEKKATGPVQEPTKTVAQIV